MNFSGPYTGSLFYLTTVACHFPQLKAVALVGGRVSGYVATINELTGRGSRRLWSKRM